MFFGCRGECALLLPDSDAGFRTIHSSRVPKQSLTAALSWRGAGWLPRAELDITVESALAPTPLPPCSQVALVASPRNWTSPGWQPRARMVHVSHSWSQCGYLLLVPGQIRAESFRLSLSISLHHPSLNSPVIHLVLHSRRDALV